MPVIAVITSKGGAGKTTTAILLSAEFARETDVVLIDADPNRPVLVWSKLADIPRRLSVRGDVNEENINDVIAEASNDAPMVIVDCEGKADITTTYAISDADLVIIPSQGSKLDGDEAVKSLKMVDRVGKMRGKEIPCAVLFNRTSRALKPGTLKAVREEFIENGVLVFKTELHDREAFRAVFSFGGTLDDLKSSEAVDKALVNAGGFADEVKKVIAEKMEK